MKAVDGVKPAALAASEATGASRQRYVLVGLLFLHTVNTYVDRVCISAAAPDIQRDLGLSNQTMGYIFGIFSLGYGLFQIPAGWMADTYGPRKSLAGVVSLWSAFTALTGAAAGALSLLVVRLLFGVAEAGAFPGATRALYNWLPVRERGLAQGIFHSGARVGAALSFFLIPLLIGLLGWRGAFVACGLGGFVWVAVWWWWFRDKPEDHPRVGAAELNHIRGGLNEDFSAARRIPLGLILTSPNMLLLMFQALASNFTVYLTLSWLMPYLVSQWGTGAQVYAAIPPIVATLSLWSSGWLVTWLYNRGHHVGSRTWVAMGGFALSAAALLLLTQAQSIGAFIALYSVALFCVESSLAPNWTACMDIGGEKSGVVSAAMNMVGNLGAALCAIVFPYFVAHVTLPYFAEASGTANSYFVFAAAINALAAVAWAFINPRRKLPDAPPPGQARRRVVVFIGALMLLTAGLIVYRVFFVK